MPWQKLKDIEEVLRKETMLDQDGEIELYNDKGNVFTAPDYTDSSSLFQS